jgi:flagellar protein FliS
MNPTARNAYLASSVTTASPARLLVMLCERLVLDIERGCAAQEIDDIAGANSQFQHAQAIVTELSSSLRHDLWKGAAGLAAIYDHLTSQLIRANVHHDTAAAHHCLALATQLADTWREAAMTAAVAS